MPTKTLVIVAHPDLAASKINAAWTAAAERLGESVTVHRLYDAYPDGRIDVAAEQALVAAHDRVVFQFPMFWFSVPPLLKQWFDRVLAYGFVYGPGGDALEGKSIGVAVSTGGKAEAYRAGGHNGWTVDELLRPIQATARFCRADYRPIHAFQGAMWGIDETALAADARAYAEWLVAA
ncbi:MAG: NAD(P)H-dependent oxidoreductase [Siculibacillus sp.]